MQMHGRIGVSGQQEQPPATRKAHFFDLCGEVASKMAGVRHQAGRGQTLDRAGGPLAVPGYEVADRDRIVDEYLPSHPHDILAAHRLDTVGIVQVETPVRRRDGFRDRCRDLGRGIPMVRRLRLHLGLGTHQLGLREPLADDRRKFPPDDPLHLLVPGRRVQRREDLEKTGVAQLPADRLDIEAQVGLDEPLVQTRGHTASEGIRQHREGVGRVVCRLGSAPRYRHPAHLSRSAYDEAPLSLLPGLARNHRWHGLRRTRQRPEVPGNQVERRLPVERADENE